MSIFGGTQSERNGNWQCNGIHRMNRLGKKKQREREKRVRNI